jgi:hypothetical protein
MRSCRFGGGLFAIFLAVAAGQASAQSAAPISLQSSGVVEMAGRSLRCGSVRNVLDPRLPNLGIAAPGVLVMNPRLLQRLSDTVRLFVYHHECGHHHVGGDEMKADCWAVAEGVKQGWLGKEGLPQVCKSFGNMPATPTHPSGVRRCANLERCFATATARIAKQQVKTAAGYTAPVSDAAKPSVKSWPKLISEPALVRDGKEATGPQGIGHR